MLLQLKHKRSRSFTLKLNTSVICSLLSLKFIHYTSINKLVILRNKLRLCYVSLLILKLRFKLNKLKPFFKFKNGKRTGQGIYIFKTGAKYEGEFYNGVMHGKGILYKIDGSKDIGIWVNGTYQ